MELGQPSGSLITHLSLGFVTFGLTSSVQRPINLVFSLAKSNVADFRVNSSFPRYQPKKARPKLIGWDSPCTTKGSIVAGSKTLSR